MMSRTLGKLEFCRKTICFPLLAQSQRLIFYHLNPQPKNYKLRHIIAQQCHSTSNVVKSPHKDVNIPNILIPEFIWETVDRFPDAIAVRCGLTRREYTYAEIQKKSNQFANSLRRAGFKRGDVLALVLPNCPEFAIITLGALEAEMAVTLINHVYTAEEMVHQLKNSGSVCLVSATEKLDVVLSAIAILEKNAQTKPFQRVIAVDIPSPESLPRGVIRFSEMVSNSVDHSRVSNQVQVNDLAFLPYSSGTTGLSKGVCLSHRNIVVNILQFSCTTRLYSPDDGQDLILGLLPFYHIYGLVVILLNALRHGSQVVTLPKFEQDSFLHTFENEKLSVLLLVPPLILFIGSSAKITAKHLSCVRNVYSGAAPLGASDMEKVKAKLPDACSISQAYGMTETSPVLTQPIIPTKNLATVGVPVPNTLGKIINPDTGESLAPNEVGELCFKGPQVMLGYHNNPKATADMIDEDGWLKTGDIGYYDEDGDFYIQDRLKELIKVKGLQVPPAELEEVLRTHPGVSDAGVIGVPCPRAGEVPVAYIVPQTDKKIMAEDIKEFLSTKVSRHKQIAEVIFVDSIPKSAAGKILRKDLRQMYKTSHKQV